MTKRSSSRDVGNGTFEGKSVVMKVGLRERSLKQYSQGLKRAESSVNHLSHQKVMTGIVLGKKIES